MRARLKAEGKRIGLILVLAWLLITAISPILIPVKAGTTTTTLTAVADAYITGEQPDTNFSHNNGELYVANNPSGNPWEEKALIKFDLSNIDSDSVVVTAKLKLYVTLKSSDNPTVCVYKITSDWSETQVTWNNAPNSSSSSEVCVSITSVNAWVEFDITGFVEEWVNGSQENYGVILAVEEDSRYVHFASREYSDSSKKPQLEVEYVEPSTVTITETTTETVTAYVTNTTEFVNTTITETITQTSTMTTTTTVTDYITETQTTTVTQTDVIYTTETAYTTETSTVTQTITDVITETATTTITETYTTWANETVTVTTTVTPTATVTETNSTVSESFVQSEEVVNMLIPIVMVIGVIGTLLGLALESTRR